VQICIPSHKRAATITTHRLAPDAIVCVPESQAAEYQAAGCPNVRTHPDSIRGLTPKLNWMLDHLADNDGIIFLDDDLEYLCRCFTSRDDKISRKVTEASLIHEIITETAALAAEMGAYFFGWESSESTIRYYSGLDPFAFTGFINGCAMGFIAGHGLRFDESIVAKNDYDICALNAFRHRICFKDTRYAFCQRETFTGSGGQSFYRNSQTEARDIAILRRKYGEAIVVGKQGGTRKRDYAGVKKVTLKLPY
jgi:TET-Associated Glycosyltransferase